MKRLIYLTMLTLFCAAALFSCSVGRYSSRSGEVQFEVYTGTGLSPLYNIEDATALLVSIEDAVGNPVYTDERLTIHGMGRGYVSDPLVLEVGSYELTKFWLIDDVNEILFLTPLEGSPKDYLVDDPLPLSFTVIIDEVTSVTPQVVDTEGLLPEDFGYVSFEPHIVDTIRFLLDVLIPVGAGWELTEADLTVTSGADTLYGGGLLEETNVIQVRDGYGSYDLLVEKAGYEPYQQTFTESVLKGYETTPLVVTLLEIGAGEWTHPIDLTDNISPDGQNSGGAQVAMDNNSNSIVVWSQREGSNYQIFMSEYRGGTWTHPADLTDNISPDGQSAGSVQVAMDDNGNAIMVWRQWDGGNQQIFMSEYRGGSWTHPADLTDNISPDGQDAYDPHVAMDNNGNAIVLWRQDIGVLNYQIFMSEYRGGTWTHPADLTDNISPDGQSASSVQAAMDDNGNAIVIWNQSDGSSIQVFMSEYRGGNWTHPADLSDNISPDGQSAYNPRVAMDNNGDAIVIWYQSDGSDNQIFMSEYRSGSWTHPADLTDNISPDGQDTYDSQVAMDNNSNAIVVWRQYDGSSYQIFMSEYRGGLWTHPADLTDKINPDGQSSVDPLAAMDDNGNSIVVWEQWDGSNYQILMSEYRGGNWTHPADLSDNISPDGQYADYPQVSMDNNGDAVVVWYQSDGIYNQIFMSEYR